MMRAIKIDKTVELKKTLKEALLYIQEEVPYANEVADKRQTTLMRKIKKALND